MTYSSHAKQYIAEARDKIEKRNRALVSANVYRNAIRHWGREMRFTSGLSHWQAVADKLQAEIDGALSSADYFLEMAERANS